MEHNRSTYCEAMDLNKKPKFIKEKLKRKESGNITLYTKVYDFWRRKLGVEIDKQIWSTPRRATKETRLRELQWKILHNICSTNKILLLQKMNVTETNQCNYYPNNVDFVEHFYYECRIVKNFWKYLEGFILSSIGLRIQISLCDVMFGVHINEQSPTNNILNHYIFLANVCISIVKHVRI